MANALRRIEAAPAKTETRWSEPQLPGRLADLVNALEPFDPERVPAISDAEADECRSALAVYRAAPKTTPVRDIDRMMLKLALGYPNQRLSDSEAEGRMELYAEQLSDIPFDILALGFAAAVRTLKFFPTVAELREMAMSQPAPRRRRRQHRIEILLAGHARRAPAIDRDTVESGTIIPAEEVEATNVALGRLGLRTRVADDGTTYQLPLGAAHPAEAA